MSATLSATWGAWSGLFKPVGIVRPRIHGQGGLAARRKPCAHELVLAMQHLAEGSAFGHRLSPKRYSTWQSTTPGTWAVCMPPLFQK